MAELGIVPEIFSVEQGAPNPEQQELGARLMRRADLWTEFRSESAKPLELLTAGTSDSRPLTDLLLAGAAGFSMFTDALDGRDARRGAAILGVETTPHGAIADPLADKALVNGLMRGLTGRFVLQGRFLSATVVALNYSVTQRRDARMENTRSRITKHGLDPDELKAHTINKIKTAGQDAALLGLISPFARVRRARIGGLVALSASTALGLIGERSMSRRVDNLIAQQEVGSSAHNIEARLT